MAERYSRRIEETITEKHLGYDTTVKCVNGGVVAIYAAKPASAFITPMPRYCLVASPDELAALNAAYTSAQIYLDTVD